MQYSTVQHITGQYNILIHLLNFASPSYLIQHNTIQKSILFYSIAGKVRHRYLLPSMVSDTDLLRPTSDQSHPAGLIGGYNGHEAMLAQYSRAHNLS